MTDTLFYVPPCDSPRLRWMKKHQVQTRHVPADPIAYEAFWRATNSTESEPQFKDGIGATEAEAITDWAIKHGVRLWNEGGL